MHLLPLHWDCPPTMEEEQRRVQEDDAETQRRSDRFCACDGDPDCDCDWDCVVDDCA
jgi:hypothetical protein